ncbi:hypothetical protein CERZMDRAFT_117109 [Cercospora zeae-maydis SCOH1-5]|uniref:Zn(2)-C6 fungal-type domain-containing protein n=1 Tax=Cercospora zeae-maydis SCOH1-5 TaxID=717836 RepID=A0A6A6FK70_9PEZI|nr:hypothetical protein CERZMDRAFT_117109 [Cercospora zeae-maydis SCOH1-5]
MARVSFGSRAGNATLGGSGRHPLIHGPYASLDDLTNALQQEFDAARAESGSVSTALELSLSLDATIPLVRPSIGPYADGGDHDLPDEFKQGLYETKGASDQKHPRAPCSAIVNVVDPTAKKIVQRAASRGIMAAIEALDGFRYSFNNAWNAQNEEGARFSFICQDSMQNKDRHANGYTRVLKHLKDPSGHERGPRKPTYDCKGSVSVKFSLSKQSCEVFYRHNAIHDTLAARKAAPRTPGGVTRLSGDWLQTPHTAPYSTPRSEEDSGGLSAMLQAETASSALAMVDSPTAPRSVATTSNIGRPLKRKREDFTRPIYTSPNPDSSLSLADLLKQSAAAGVPPSPSENSFSKFIQGAAAVAYELPTWQKPPPSMNRSAGGPSYQMPYQPQARTASASNSTAPAHPPPLSQPTQSQRPAPGFTQSSGPGLYTIMKVKNPPKFRPSHQNFQTLPHTEQFGSHTRPRSAVACTSCRIAKRRCDEVRPICGLCVKLKKTECHYEGPALQSAASGQRSPGLAQPPVQPSQGSDQGSMERQAESNATQSNPQSIQSAQPSQHTSATLAPKQEKSQTSWDNDSSSSQHKPLASWPQGSHMPPWPSQGPHSLQTWGNVAIPKPASPDPWFPKR